MRFVFLAIAFLSLGAEAATAQVVGRAGVLTSDTFQLRGQVFQLHGVDSIEFHQFCLVEGRAWACGASATRAFQTLLDPVIVTCEATGEMNGDAAFAVCTSEEGDIADIMVRQGWALAVRDQSEDYVATEEAARAAGEGVWVGAVVEPWIFREDMAAIEARLAERTTAAIPTEVVAVLLADAIEIGFLTGNAVAEAPTAGEGATSVDQEVRVAKIGAGFILDSIEARGVFNWQRPVEALATWRRAVLSRIREAAINAVLVDLSVRRSEVAEVELAETYYAAMIEGAAPWIDAGRQPVLLVAGVSIPEWIAIWLSDAPPEGAEVTIKEDIETVGYLGTIDGIDIYSGSPIVTESYLFPEDLLIDIAFMETANGGIVTVELDEAAEQPQLVFRFTQLIRWLEDTIVILRYPYEDEAPYGS